VDVDIAATRETAPTAEEGPGRQGSLNRGLSVPGGSGMSEGNAAHIISVVLFLFYP
jgi:hypothetical protein